MKIYEHPHQVIEYDESLSLFKIRWFFSDKTSITEFKQQVLAYLEQVKKYKPTLALFNVLESDFVIPVEVQEWFDKEITVYEKEFFRKQAVCMSEDNLVALLSAEQLMDEENNSLIEIKMFDKLSEALDWLLAE